MCHWIDCLGRQVKMREILLEEASDIIHDNLIVFEDIEPLSEKYQFVVEINGVIMKMIIFYHSQEEYESIGNILWVKESEVDFIHCDGYENIPTPIFFDTSPENAQNFIIHIIFSLGKYKTDIDALTHKYLLDCLCVVCLIRPDTDEESLKHYSVKLACKYIEKQVVFYPNSLSRTETFIVMEKYLLMMP